MLCKPPPYLRDYVKRLINVKANSYRVAPMNRKKIHKVRWELVCNPKHEGGLGIRQMRPLNNALLAKKTWKVLSGEDNLSIKILQSKYVKAAHDVTQLMVRPSNSPTWKSLIKQIPLIQMGSQTMS